MKLADYGNLLAFFKVVDVDKKIRNIRTIYSRESANKRDKKSGDGADDVYKPKWIHFKNLKFLDEFVTQKSSRSNLQEIYYCKYNNIIK